MLYNYDELMFHVLSINQLSWEKGHFSVLPRSFSALVFRIRGTGNFSSGDCSFTSCPGDVLFLPAGMGYEVDYTDSKIIAIHFLNCNYRSSAENFTFTDAILLHERFQKILETWNAHACSFTVNAMIYELLASMRRVSENKYRSDDTFYRSVVFMNEQYRSPDVSITKICQECGISEANLRLKFDREFHLSPKKYLIKLRLDFAIRMLSEKMYTVEQIANASGFTDVKYFSRVIKETYGLPPSTLAGKLKI